MVTTTIAELKQGNNNDRKGGKTMFLGLSLTTWLILLGVFTIITPIIGKQVAKDSIRFKDSLQDPDREFLTFVLFPFEMLSNEKVMWRGAPIQSFTEKEYVRRMMMGGVWVKFFFNFASMAFFFLAPTIGFIIYAIGAFFRGIFSTK